MKKACLLTALLAAIATLVCCSKNKDAQTATTTLSALPLTATAPADNPQTASKAALGRLLFWDPILSGNKDVACASCHHPSLGYGDGLDLSLGVNAQGLGTMRHFLLPNDIPFARRNALPVVNAAFNGLADGVSYDPSTAAMFFDSRVRSLELQSLEPIKTLEEMRGRTISQTAILDTVVARLKSNSQYGQLFAGVFGTTNAVTAQNLGRAVAAYERTLLANHSPFDEYARGNASAMSAAQVQGMNAFTANGCNKCHSGPMFSDYALHVLSVPDNSKLPTDAGANGSYSFRTPSLRNLSFTAPYMHSGVFADLQQVLDFYERVGDRHSQNGHVGDAQLDANLHRVNGRDKAAIIDFLGALNDGSFDRTIPASVPSGLHPGGNL